MEEFEAFDAFSLVGELGGALGLFLGWSCLNLLLDLVQIGVNSCCRRNRSSGQGKRRRQRSRTGKSSREKKF